MGQYIDFQTFNDIQMDRHLFLFFLSFYFTNTEISVLLHITCSDLNLSGVKIQGCWWLSWRRSFTHITRAIKLSLIKLNFQKIVMNTCKLHFDLLRREFWLSQTSRSGINVNNWAICSTVVPLSTRSGKSAFFIISGQIKIR